MAPQDKPVTPKEAVGGRGLNDLVRGRLGLGVTDIAASPMLPLAAGAVAVGIFLVDTVTSLEIAIAVVYVVVVLLAAIFLRRRGVLLVSAACIALTILSYSLTHDFSVDGALLRCLVSLSAIAIATVLALMNQAAHSQLRKQANLLDLTHDAVFVRRMDDIITYWNRGAEQLYGWTSEEATGKAAHTLLSAVFPESREAIMAELTRAGRWEGEVAHTNRTGAQIIVASRWSLQRNERGDPVAILETNTDVTAAKQAQEELQHVQSELAHVSRVTMLGELSASIAHEVNQPLATIVINAEGAQQYLAHMPPKVEEARRVVDRIIQSAERAANVIRRIRALSKKATPEMARLDINDVIEETLPLVRSQATSNRVALTAELAPALPAVLADRVQVQQVIINLIINAIDAMKGVDDRRRELFVRTHRTDDGKVLVSVQDSGVGIDPEKANRLFDAFFTTKSDGMGMGLSISRSIVEAHGGRIWASPNMGPGATLQFTLPQAGEMLDGGRRDNTDAARSVSGGATVGSATRAG